MPNHTKKPKPKTWAEMNARERKEFLASGAGGAGLLGGVVTRALGNVAKGMPKPGEGGVPLKKKQR